MKLKLVALLFLVSAVTGCVGYYVGVTRETDVTHTPRDAMAALDYLVSAKSFSEIEHARAALEALAARYAEKAQGLITGEVMSRNPTFGIRQSSSERPIVAAIKMLDQPLLFALKQERLYDRWLDVYLDALYRQPTHEMVSSLAGDAVAISQAVGRERELTTGLRYASDIPPNFPSKSRIDSVVHTNARITGEHHECQL